MGKTTLIVGFGRGLPQALASEALRRSRAAVLALAPLEGESPAESPARSESSDLGAISLPYRPGSALSARGLFLEASTGRESVSELIISCEPGPAFKPVLGADARCAETYADERVRAWFQLIREAINQFRRSGKGAIAFCAPAPARLASGLPRQSGFAALERDMFISLADSCLPEYTPEVPVYGSSGRAGSEESFASVVFRTLDDPRAKSRGRWTKAGKGKFLGIF